MNIYIALSSKDPEGYYYYYYFYYYLTDHLLLTINGTAMHLCSIVDNLKK